MMHSSRPAAAFICGVLLLALAAHFLPYAGAQAATGPTILDITAGTPVTGGNFTITVKVISDVGISTVHVYPHFIVSGDPVVLMGILMEPLPGDNYEASLDIPINAMELKYSVIAKDNNQNMSNTDVITRPVQDIIDPVAECEPTDAFSLGTVHTFNGSASTDNVGIANYTWTFQHNGTTVQLYGVAPSFEFGIAGQYMGNLVVRDYWNNSDSKAFLVTVTDAGTPDPAADNESPVADAGTNVNAVAGAPVTFDGSGSTDNVGIANYTWTFTHNGTLETLHGVSPSFVFWTPGVYEVTLTVRDAAGNSGTALLSVHIEESPGEGSGIPWWAYVLAAMVCVFMVMGYFILKE